MSWTLGSAGLVSAHIIHAATGTWLANVEVNTEQPITGAQTLRLPGLDLVGYVVDGGVSVLRQRLSVVGGRGGLSKIVAGQAFSRTQVRTIVEHLLAQAGEVLASDSDAAVLGTNIPHWTHATTTCGAGLDAICEQVGTIWWVDPAGAVHVGDHDWRARDVADLVILKEDLRMQRVTVATLEDVIRPGTTWRDHRVGSVEHTFDTRGAEGFRSLLHIDSEGHPLDDDFRDMIRHHQIKALPAYEGRVVVVNADGTLDIEPARARAEVGPGWQNVEIALQGPFFVKPRPGARCVVSFLDNLRTHPFVSMFLPGKPTGARGTLRGLNGTTFADGLEATAAGGIVLRLLGEVTIPGDPPGSSNIEGSFEAVNVPPALVDVVGPLTPLTWTSPPAGAEPTVTLTSGFASKGTVFDEVRMEQGGEPAARKGDAVDGGTILLVAPPPANVVTGGSYIPAGTPLPAPLPAGAITLKLESGKITGGSDVVKKIA